MKRIKANIKLAIFFKKGDDMKQYFKIKFLILLFTFISYFINAETIEIVEGSVEIQTDEITFDFTIRDINTTDLKPEYIISSTGLQLLTESQHVTFYFPITENKPIIQDNGIEQIGNTHPLYSTNYFYQVIDGNLNPSTVNVNQYDLTGTITIKPNTNNNINDMGGRTEIMIGFTPFLGGQYGTIRQSQELQLPQNFDGPIVAPENFGLTATYKSATATWKVHSRNEQIDYTNNQSFNPPSKVVAIVISPEVSDGAELKAKEIQTDQNDLNYPDSICTYSKNDCSIECPTGEHFIDPDSTGHADGIEVISTGNNGFKAISPLEVDQEYIVFLQYQKGTQRTECKKATPFEDYTLTGLNGGSETEGDPRCFIVSAAYGSSFAKEIDIFRWARDKFLNTNSLGRNLVDFYYRNSPILADQIRQSPSLQVLMRSILWVPAKTLKALKWLLEPQKEKSKKQK
ncbi:MAG: hypothetical protein CMP11_06035 [Zetaproteobacteria bacterium]|nr:hypothetical protein [Pseudobdellovibrionaceae bacterium]